MTVKTYICTKSVLLANGLMHYIRKVSPDTIIEISPSIPEIVNNTDIQFSIVIIDTRLFTFDPVLLMEKIRGKNSSGKLIGISDGKVSERVLPYFDFTVGFDSNEKDLLQIFEKIYFSSQVLVDNVDDSRIISSREIEILKYVALGLTNKEIADTLNISAHTVITHRKNITAKLGIKTIAGLTVYAIINNIIRADEVD